MKIQIDLDEIPLYYHIIFVLVVLFAIPECFQWFTRTFVALFALFYRCIGYLKTIPPLSWCLPKQTSESQNHERSFKMLTSDDVAKKMVVENEYRNISGFLTFKWGFPYIFRTRHLQLYKTKLIIRDADDMKKYNKKRTILLRQQKEHMQSLQSLHQPNSSISPQSVEDDEIEHESAQHDLVIQTSTGAVNLAKPINSHTFQPPKPLWIFDLSQGGKVVNSRLPMTLKLVSNKTEMSYIQFKDKGSYAYWCTAFTKNLHLELTETWRKEAVQMHLDLQQVNNSTKLSNATPLKFKSILTTTPTTTPTKQHLI